MGIILYDWYSMTSHCDSLISMTELLGLTDLSWVDTYGYYGYKQRMYYDGISIHYDGQPNQGILLEMSGQGCRTFETFSTHKNWDKLFSVGLTSDYNITRLDVAYDDKPSELEQPILNMMQIAKQTRQQRYVSKMSAWEVIYSNKGITVNIGSKSSDTFIRFYDKASERGLVDGSHWVRCELQLRRDRATEFICQQLTIGEKYCGVIRNYLRYVTPNKNDTNKRRWSNSKWYNYWLGVVEPISIFTPKDIDYNLSHVERYIMQQAGNSIAAYIECVGIDYFQKQLKQRPTCLNTKQKHLIETYRQKYHPKKTEKSLIDWLIECSQ